MTPLDAALLWLRGQLPAVEEHLERLVALNSFSSNPEGCAAVAGVLRELLSIEGLQGELLPGNHLHFRTQAPGPQVGLVGHLDTVFPPGTFEGYRRDGELRRGPGVLDMKGGLVVVAFALKAMAQEGLLASVPLGVVVVSDEEVGSPAGKQVLQEKLGQAQAALVFEAGRAGDALITQRKGTGTLRLVAGGRKAHAGNQHEAGVNAIWGLARVIDRVQQLTRYEEGRTVNVGRIEGGEVANTVPDRAEALVDLRFTSDEQGRWLLDAIERASREVEAEMAGLKLQVRGGLSRSPMRRTEASVRLLERYATGARAEGLGASEAPLLGGGSDACTTSAMGIASIDGLGPRGKGFHTHDEQIEVGTLIPKAAALVRFLAGEPGALAAPAAVG
jgi:glutamate carboxypeptidase